MTCIPMTLPDRLTKGPKVQYSNWSVLSLSPKQIMDIVCVYFECTLDDIKSRRRMRDIVIPRQVACFFLREKTRLSLNKIGALVGHRDHTSILYYMKQIKDLSDSDPLFAQDIHYIRHLLDRATWVQRLPSDMEGPVA